MVTLLIQQQNVRLINFWNISLKFKRILWLDAPTGKITIGQLKKLQYQMTQNRMMAAIPQADVVIVNPEHYAVALRYQQGGQSAAPQLVQIPSTKL